MSDPLDPLTQLLSNPENPLYKTSENATRRMAYKAGIKIVSDSTRLPILAIALATMDYILKKAIIYLKNQKKVVLKPSHFEAVIKDLGGSIYNVDSVSQPCKAFDAPSALETVGKPRKRKQGSVTDKAIRFYQKQSDCYYIPRQYFLEQMKTLYDDENVMASAAAIDLYQGIVEGITVNNLIIAHHLLEIMGKEKLTPKIIEQSSFLINEIQYHIF